MSKCALSYVGLLLDLNIYDKTAFTQKISTYPEKIYIGSLQFIFFILFSILYDI